MRFKANLFLILALSVGTLLPITLLNSDATLVISAQSGSTGLQLNSAAAYPGYTLFAPLSSRSVYLIDMNGEVVKRWALDGETAQEAYLLPNGDLLAQVVPEEAPHSQFADAMQVAQAAVCVNTTGTTNWFGHSTMPRRIASSITTLSQCPTAMFY